MRRCNDYFGAQGGARSSSFVYKGMLYMLYGFFIGTISPNRFYPCEAFLIYLTTLINMLYIYIYIFNMLYVKPYLFMSQGVISGICNMVRYFSYYLLFSRIALISSIC
jgi:hypothetical protein